MPPKKKAAAAAPKKLPPPNLSHSCAPFLAVALDPSSFAERPHPASYHTFLSSPFYPSSTRTLSNTDEPPTKRKKKDADPPLPPLLDVEDPGNGPIDASVVQRKMLEWYDGRKESRGMPWRKEVRLEELTREQKSQRGYEVWVSEIMLQQTQVATVIPYWTRWMEAFPTVQDLAKADPEEVNAVWKGLGYYSRAKRLLEGAKTVVEKHNGLIPSTVEGLLQVDGIGPYTAGAVSSIAFARRSPLVDGNVQRVLSRLTAFHAPPAAKATTNFIWALADVLVPAQPKKNVKGKKAEEEEEEERDPTTSPHFKRKRKEQDDLADVGGPNKPGAWNQALMELGATVCTPKNPKCDECPVSEECLGYAEARYFARPPPATSSSSSTLDPPNIEDLCTLCSPLPPLSPGEAHSVEAYPMAKEKTKKREEETAVCVLEWKEEGKEGDGEERKVLLVKRPEKGLLAGLYEFPAVDLPPSTPSTPKSRSKAINALLPTLLDVSGLSSALSASSEKGGAIKVLERTTLPPVEHIYSHMKRTYFAERIVLSSASLPSLHTSSSSATSSKKSSKTDEDEVLQSLPGRGKWVDASAVEGENTGGAVGKVWEERERVVKGLGGGKEKKAGGAKGKAKGKKEEKGQGSLLGFFAKREVVKANAGDKEARPEEKGKGKKRAEESDDDLIIVEEEEKVQFAVVKEGKENEAKAQVEVKVEEKKVYKKRRIAPASDEEDEGWLKDTSII